jgi:hypothetical protein
LPEGGVGNADRDIDRERDAAFHSSTHTAAKNPTIIL